MTEPTRPPLPPFDEASARPLGAGRRGRLEHPGSGAGRRGLHARTPSGATATSSSPAAPRSSPSSPRKWARELDYALRKSLWTFADDRIAVRFQYEWHDAAGQTWRSYGNELWEFADNGLMRRREASINDVAIAADRAPHPRPAPRERARTRHPAALTRFMR